MPKLNLPWGETIQIESMEQFHLDIMMLTAEYYVRQPDLHLVVVSSKDFVLQEDDETITVRSCTIRVVVEWDDDNDAEFDKRWKDFASPATPPKLPRKDK